MYYEINVSKDGSHFFATSKRSLSTSQKTKELTKLFLEKFPEEEGYKISVSFNPERSNMINGIFKETPLDVIDNLYF